MILRITALSAKTANNCTSYNHLPVKITTGLLLVVVNFLIIEANNDRWRSGKNLVAIYDVRGSKPCTSAYFCKNSIKFGENSNVIAKNRNSFLSILSLKIAIFFHRYSPQFLHFFFGETSAWVSGPGQFGDK